MRQDGATPDRIVAEIAARQHGVVTFAQLIYAGLSPSGISRRVAAGRLHRIHRGVYAVGHPGLGDEGRWSAAVLACGEGAVLSHRSAAELWELLPASQGRVHVTIPTASGRRRRRGIRVHRSPSLTEAVTTRRERIACTTPARTLQDLRRSEPAWLVRKAARQAEFLATTSPGFTPTAPARTPRPPSCASVAATASRGPR